MTDPQPTRISADSHILRRQRSRVHEGATRAGARSAVDWSSGRGQQHVTNVTTP